MSAPMKERAHSSVQLPSHGGVAPRGGPRYLLATANVMLFARAVDPGLRLAEDGAAAFIALDLRERTMAMLRIAAHKLVLPALLLVCSAVLIKSAVDVWQTWQQTETLMAQLQREKAEAAAQRIESFVQTIVGQIGWVAQRQWAALPVEQRRFDYVRLLRQVPAITELGQLDGEGREQLKVSRLSWMWSAASRSFGRARVYQATAIQATANRVYWGPVYYRKASEPYMTVPSPWRANRRHFGRDQLEICLGRDQGGQGWRNWLWLHCRRQRSSDRTPRHSPGVAWD